MPRYILLHESRYGMKIYRFSSQRFLAKMQLMGMTVFNELDGDHRDLLRFLSIAVEPGDYIIIVCEPETQGVW